MKAQFKYAILSGLYIRGIVFAIIFTMNTIFIVLGSLGLLPFPAHVTAVSLCGVGIAAMLAANIGSDVMILRRMFAAPDAYFYMLTPAPRWKILLASITTMTVMDLFSMTIVITQQVWLSLNMVGRYFMNNIWEIIQTGMAEQSLLFWSFPYLIACYLLLVMIILFCYTAYKSILYKKTASGLLAFLLAFGCFYAVSLLQLLLAPFGTVTRFGLLLIINFSGNTGLPLITVLTLLEAATLFFLTSKLMERRMNI